MSQSFGIKVDGDKSVTVKFDAGRDKQDVAEFFQFVLDRLTALWTLGKASDSRYAQNKKPKGYFHPLQELEASEKMADTAILEAAKQKILGGGAFKAATIAAYAIKGPSGSRGMGLDDVNKGWFEAIRSDIDLQFVSVLKNNNGLSRACAALWLKSEGGTKLVSENPIIAAAGGDDSNISADFGVPLAALSLLRAWGGNSNVKTVLEADAISDLKGAASDKPRKPSGEDKGTRKDDDDKDDDRGKGDDTKEEAPKEKSVEEQQKDLDAFLEQHKELTNGDASLSAMVAKIGARAANADAPHCYKSYVDAIRAPLQGVGGKSKDAWKGTTIEGREFAATPSGLLDFLRFAWVATHGAEQTWLAAADQIGFNPGGKQLPEDQTVKALIRMGAISPAGLLGVGIEGGGIPSGAKLIFVPGQQFESFRTAPAAAITYNFGRDYASGVIITIGANQPRSGPAPGISSDIDAVISAEDSKRIVEKWGEQTTFVMQVGNRAALVTRAIDTGTIIFKLPGAAVTTGRTGAAGDQARVSGMYIAGGRTIPGVTESTPQDIVMSLENVYVDGTGTVKQRVVDATLKKTAMSLRNRDAYELKAVGGDYILIPVTLKRPQTQAATDTSSALHWAAAALGTADAAAQQLAYVPVSEITWQFRGNYQIAGDPVPPIEVVSAVGAPVENVREKGLQLISEEEADIEAVPGSGPFDPFDNAIAAYIRDKNNPVGQALVLTPRLNGAMNSLPIKVSKID